MKMQLGEMLIQRGGGKKMAERESMLAGGLGLGAGCVFGIPSRQLWCRKTLAMQRTKRGAIFEIHRHRHEHQPRAGMFSGRTNALQIRTKVRIDRKPARGVGGDAMAIDVSSVLVVGGIALAVPMREQRVEALANPQSVRPLRRSQEKQVSRQSAGMRSERMQAHRLIVSHIDNKKIGLKPATVPRH